MEWTEDNNPAEVAVDWARLGELARDPHLRERALVYCEVGMQVFTVEELAELLKVTRKTVRGWIRTGELPASALGHKVGFRVTDEDLREFFKAHRVIPNMEPAVNPGELPSLDDCARMGRQLEAEAEDDKGEEEA